MLNTGHEKTDGYVIKSQKREYKQGAANESKITWDRYSKSMMTWTSVTHLLRALMMKSNGRSNGNKWTVYFRALIYDTLAVTHKCWDSLPIKTGNNYKRKGQHNPKVHANTDPKTTPSHFSLKIIFLLYDLSITVFLVNTTPVYYTSFPNFLAGLHRRHDQLCDPLSSEMRSSTWWFFASLEWI